MVTLLTLNNTCIHKLLNFLFFSQVHSQSKCNFGCYIIETAASIASNVYHMNGKQ